MNTFRAKLLLSFLAASGIAGAGDETPVGRAEAMACKSQIAAYHDQAIKTLSGYVSAVCSSPRLAESEYERKYCETEKAQLQKVVEADDIEWWLAENRICSATYGCFGPHMYESEHVEYKRMEMEERAKSGSLSGNAGSASENLDTCIARSWLARNPVSEEEGAAKSGADPAGGSDRDVKSDPIHAARCAEALAEQDRQFTLMNQNAPKPGASNEASGAKALFQMGMYITSQRLELLDRFCQGEPQYSTYAPTKESYETALNGCRALASDGGESCKPLKLW